MGKSKAVHVVSGTLGVSAGMDVGTQDTIQEDADGVPSELAYVVDIPHLLSRSLGKQIPQMATFRIKGLGMSLKNVDDANDNNYGIAAGGRVRFFQPTKHRIDALQYARRYKREASVANEHNTAGDPFAYFTNEKHYKGLRFNWKDDGETLAQITDDPSILGGTYFSMEEIFHHYNTAIGGDATEEGRPTSGEGMALWTSRTGSDTATHIYWNAYYRNSAYQDGTGFENAFIFQPEMGAWEFNLPADNHLDVLGGLLRVTYAHSNTDNPRSADVNDNYALQFYALVEGWEEF